MCFLLSTLQVTELATSVGMNFDLILTAEAGVDAYKKMEKVGISSVPWLFFSFNKTFDGLLCERVAS